MRTRPTSRTRIGAALLAMGFMTGACGLRVSPGRLAQARNGQRVSAAGTTTGANPQASSDVVAGTGPSAATSAEASVAASAAGVDGSGSRADTGSGANAAAGPRPGAAAPAGGNGGATDVGVTATSITLGNVSTLTGPVPGIFQGAVIGTQAAVAYLNSQGGINGRQFKLDVRDDQFDTGQNRAQTIDLIGKSFAFAGSFSLYDDAAINQIKSSNIVDTTYSLSDARRAIPNNFSVQPGHKGWRTGPLNYFKSKFPNSVVKVGTLYGDVPASVSSYQGWKAAAESVGYKVIYERGFSPTETDFTADVVRMRQSGVKMIYLTAADVRPTARLAKAMAQQNFVVDAFVSGGVAYDPNFVTLGGSATNGVYDEQQMSMYLGEDSTLPEVKLFNDWVHKVRPGYKPDLFAVFGWGSVRLLADAITAAGPNITRASVNDAIRRLGQYDVHGLIAPANPGTKQPPTCYILIRVNNGKFQRFDSPPPNFRCSDGGYFKVPGTP
jgi:ABC-type branched-subunit amino acid transport system substrate-binding protein